MELFGEVVVGAEQTSDKCLLGSWLQGEERQGFALDGRKGPLGCLTPDVEDLA